MFIVEDLIYHVDNIEGWEELLFKYNVYSNGRLSNWNRYKEESMMHITVSDCDGKKVIDYSYGNLKYAKEFYNDRVIKYKPSNKLLIVDLL